MRKHLLLLALLSVPAGASVIDYDKKEVTEKLVYVATTDDVAEKTVESIYLKLEPNGKLPPPKKPGVPSYTFLPVRLGLLRGFRVVLHLYAFTTAEMSAELRANVLSNLDGVVFVAGSSPARQEANAKTFEQLKSDLARLGYDWRKLPLVVQLTGSGSLTPEQVRSKLGLPATQQVFAADLQDPKGAFEALSAVSKAALRELSKPAR